jgi:Ca2+-binding RTX toxin-like protein
MITLAVPASGITIGISGGVLIVGTEPGDGNQLFTPTIAGLDLVFSNLDADIVTPGCTGVGSITCPLAGFQELVILGGDGDDVIQLSGISGPTFAITALGGPGNDVLVGTPGNVKLFGGPGNDVLIVMPGNCFSRGTGDDIVLGSGCDAGPEPAIAPLPRPSAETPEPGGLSLIGTVLVGIVVTTRMRLRLGLTKGSVANGENGEATACGPVTRPGRDTEYCVDELANARLDRL